MPVAPRKSKSTTISADIKALADELGVPVKVGTIKAVRDRFFVTVGGRQAEIPVGELNSASEVKRLSGRRVPVIVKGRTIVAVGFPKRPWIICYIPAPDVIREIRPELRQQVINRYVDMNIISKDLGRQLSQGLK